MIVELSALQFRGCMRIDFAVTGVDMWLKFDASSSNQSMLRAAARLASSVAEAHRKYGHTFVFLI